MAIDTHVYSYPMLNDPVAIVGFPSVGLVSSIMASYCITQMELAPVVGFNGPGMPPYCIITSGVAYPPVRIFGGRGRTKTARDILVCTAEFAPKAEDCYEMGLAVLEGLRDLGCRQVVCLEGMPRMSPDDTLVACSSGVSAAEMVEKSGVTKLDNGMIKGLSGVMMAEAGPLGMSVATLLCPANPAMPDPGAAAGFLEPLGKMIKGFRISPKPLLEEAEQIRKKADSQTSCQKDDGRTMIYG